MKPTHPHDVPPAVYKIFDEYVHGVLDRRGFVQKVSKLALGGFTAAGLLEYLSPRYAFAAQTQEDDKRLKNEMMEFASPKGGGTIKGLLSRPAGKIKKHPAVVVVHENRGLNPHIKDVARRLGLEGFLALAPDALSPLGGYPGNDDDGRALQKKRDKNDMLEDFIAGFEYLKAHEESTGKVGVLGFCFGGWISNMMAVKLPDLAAAVPFYGRQPEARDVKKIKAPLLIHYAGDDERVNAGMLEYEQALKKNKISFKAHVYEGAKHGFHNDTTPRYDKASAQLAWGRTLDFFKTHLS